MYAITAVLVFCTLFMSCIQAGSKLNSTQTRDTPGREMPSQEPEITKEKALKIAEESAAQTVGGVERFNALPCDNLEFWRVAFEPKAGIPLNSGPEYVIDKKTGTLVAKHDLPFGDRSNSERAGGSQKIEREEAVKIASRDAKNAYGARANFDLTVCEFSNTWRVIYSVKKGLNGGGPEYVIGKYSGSILEKKYYQ